MAHKLTILADNRALNKNLRICWGFSCLVDDGILFDTGESGEILISNMKKLKVLPQKIEKIVISHDHFDHTGGLESFLRENSHVEIYLLSDFSDELKRRVTTLGAKLIENDLFKEIDTDIYTTGKIEEEYARSFIPEQSMVVKGKEGLAIITGCAHPGILNIIERVKKEFSVDRVSMVLGGFHLFEKDRREIDFIVDEFKKLKVEKVGPAHCTGEEAIQIFRNRFGDKFILIGAGTKIQL